MNGFELAHGPNSKIVKFENEGRVNEKQKKYFETLFDKDLNIRTDYDEFSYFGAFRSGKSFSQQLAVFLLCLRFPKLKVIFIRDTYDQLKDSVIKQFNDEFQSLGAYDFFESAREARFKNGSLIKFRTFEKDTGILSTEYDVIAVCQAEDIPYDLFLQLIGRASGKVLGNKGIILTEGNPATGWVKERYKDRTQEQLKSKRIFFLEGQTQDNPWITKEYIQSLIDNYPKFWLDRYLYGLWDNREELVFSEFREDINIVDIIAPATINKDFIRRNGFDYGQVNPSACIYGFCDYDGVLTIYDEFYRPKTAPEDLAKEINRHGRIITVADHAMRGNKLPIKDDEERTVWTELERFGARLIPCNKEELSNIVFTNTQFKIKKLLITKNCVNLIREIKNWKWKRIRLGAEKNQYEEPVDKNNHGCDALNYLVADIFGREAENSADKELVDRSLLKAIMTDPVKVSSFS